MHQPDALQTSHTAPWAWGTGNSVWAMFCASMAGDIPGLRQLLAAEPSLVKCSWSYRNPLHFAAREDQADAVRLLLEAGSDITFTNEQWHTSARRSAEERGSVEISALLSEHLEQKFGICPAGDEVAEAVRSRDSQAIRAAVLRHGPHVADERGNKPIHWAAMTRQLQVIDLCLEAGADINAVRPDGARALDLTNGDYWYRGPRDSPRTAMKNHWTVAGYLIARGAEYDLTTACRVGDIEQVRSIVAADPAAADRDALYSTWYCGFPLRSAAKAGYIDIVRFLLDAGADPNKPEHGLAPWGGAVFDATQNSHIDIVRMLLQHGGNPNQSVESCGSPLSVASAPAIRDLLVSHGALHDPFGCAYGGHKDHLRQHCEADPQIGRDAELLRVAVDRGHLETAEVFMQSDPEILQRMQATLGDSPETTQWLLNKGMNINQVNWLDEHALHAGFDPEELPRWKAAGVNLNLIDSEHRSTPLGMAARRGRIDQVRALLDAGADPHPAGADFARPIAWAERGGHREIVRLLARA